jgi:hypothetical protein
MSEVGSLRSLHYGQEAIRTVVDDLPFELIGERVAVGMDNGLVSTASPSEIAQQRVLFRGMWLRSSLHPISALAQRNLNLATLFR